MTDHTSTVDALVADADRPQGYPFEFGGVTFRIRPQFDIRCMAAMERGAFALALKYLLGEQQVTELLELDTDEVLDGEKLGEMVTIAATGQGTTAGESAASSSS